LKKRHEKLLQVIASKIPSFSKITIKESFVVSHPLKKVYDGDRSQYEQSIKKTIRDYLHDVYHIHSHEEEDLIKSIYTEFREKEDLLSKIPNRQHVFKFLDTAILTGLREGGEGSIRQTAKNIQSANFYNQKKVIQDMINNLKIKLKLKTLNVETANVKKFSTTPFLSQIYGIPIPISHEEEKTAKQLLQEKDFQSLFEKYRSFSP
jgi:hypothetical protein